MIVTERRPNVMQTFSGGCLDVATLMEKIQEFIPEDKRDGAWLEFDIDSVPYEEDEFVINISTAFDREETAEEEALRLAEEAKVAKERAADSANARIAMLRRLASEDPNAFAMVCNEFKGGMRW